MSFFGLRVIEERSRLGLTQEGFAERAGISRRQLNRIEAGKNTSLKVIIRISGALDVPAASLFSEPSPETMRRIGRPANKIDE